MRRRAALAACALAGVVIVGCASEAPQRADDGPTREIALANPGFELTGLTAAGLAQGWLAIEHASTGSYAFAVDDDIRHSGARSFRIAYIGPEPFGAVLQKVRDPALRGKRVRFSAWLRTREATGNGLGGGGVLLVQAMRAGTPIAHDHMRGAAVKGTTDWRRYALTLTVPGDADELEVGAMLFGGGTLWFDDATLEIVER